MTIPDKLKSRKLWVAIAGAILPPLLSYISADVDLVEALRLSAAAVLAYLISQGYVDGKTMEGWIPDNLQSPDEE